MVIWLRLFSPQMLSRSLDAASLLGVTLPWQLTLVLPPQAEYLAMPYPSKLLALSAPQTGTAPPRQRVGKITVVSSPLLLSNAPSTASGSGIRRPAQALPQQLRVNCGRGRSVQI